MLLENKVAVIYGAGGAIGGAVAREGATVLLAGRTRASLEHVAGEIRSRGGLATSAALDAMEGLRRQWACELGPHGIRVVTLKTGGVPESIHDGFPGKDEITASIQEVTLLKRAATLADVGNVAAFLASDLARTITATEVNISSGAMMD